MDAARHMESDVAKTTSTWRRSVVISGSKTLRADRLYRDLGPIWIMKKLAYYGYVGARAFCNMGAIVPAVENADQGSILALGASLQRSLKEFQIYHQLCFARVSSRCCAGTDATISFFRGIHPGSSSSDLLGSEDQKKHLILRKRTNIPRRRTHQGNLETGGPISGPRTN